MLNEKEQEIYDLIVKLYNNRVKSIGLPLQSVFIEVKRRGIFESNYHIKNKIKKFDNMGLIKVEGWSIVEVNEKE